MKIKLSQFWESLILRKYVEVFMVKDDFEFSYLVFFI